MINVNIALRGGLGNQMFQYFLGRSLTSRGYTVTYDPSRINIAALPGPHVRSNPMYGLGGFRYPEIKFGPPVGKVFSESSMIFDQAAFQPKEDTTLDGYWQTEKYFLDIQDILRAQTWPCSYDSGRMAAGTRMERNNSVVVQVRRGDYLQYLNYHGVLPREYYLEGIAKTGATQVYIITDDEAWCRANLPGEIVN